MTDVTIIGAGNMGSAIAGIVTAGGNGLQVLTREAADAAAVPGATGGTIGDAVTGDIVVLALPYPAVPGVLAQYEGQLDGKVVVDLTNPVDFETFDRLVVPAGASAAEEFQALAPRTRVLKAFNTTFAAALASGTIGSERTAVLIAGDDADAKALLAGVLEAGGIRGVDAGALKRAHELEALGFLQMTLAASGKTSWSTGFALVD